jgi:hypothetical protein
MRSYIIILLSLTCFESTIYAQESQNTNGPETKILLKDSGSGGVEFSTFYGEIAPSTAFSTINKTLGKVLMSEFGIHLNRKFTLGFYMARSPNTNLINVPAQGSSQYPEWLDAGIELDQLPTGATQAFVYFSHTGINLAYMHKTERVLFWRAGFRLGSGKLQLTAEKRQLFNFLNTSIFEKKVLNINPEVGIGVNLRSWWRLHFDFGYQFVFDSTETNIDLGDFDGSTFKLGFAFGNFSK